MIGGDSGCGLFPWSSLRKVGAYELESREDIFGVTFTYVIDSALRFLPSQMLFERRRAN